MEKSKLKGKVQTILGPMEADELGIVLPHEHLFMDYRSYFIEPKPNEKELSRQPISLQNLSWVRYHKKSSLDNVQLNDEEMAISEALLFKKARGDTIVDLTPNNVGRNPLGLMRVARATGLNVIMGSAYYTEQSYRSEMHMDSKTEEDIAEEFVREITVSVGDSGLRAGIIGELGCSWPLTNNERKVLRAAAIAQQRTGAPINVHPGYHEDAPLEIINVLSEAGADPTHVIISHISLCLATSASKRYELAEKACYLEYDQFGTDGLYPPLPTLNEQLLLLNDLGRIKQIIELIAGGYLNQILISQDLSFKVEFTRFGGGGYVHILNNVIPVMRSNGITEEQVHTLMVENPKRVLSFA